MLFWAQATRVLGTALVVLLRLSSLRFLSQYSRIIVSYLYRDNSCACGAIYLLGTFSLQCKHNWFTTNLLKFQHASLHAASYRKQRSACDCATLDEQRLHKISPQLPLKSFRRWSGAVFMTSQLPACVSVASCNLVYFVQFERKMKKKTCSLATDGAGMHNATEHKKPS